MARNNWQEVLVLLDWRPFPEGARQVFAAIGINPSGKNPAE
jgi:hypothetical protein